MKLISACSPRRHRGGRSGRRLLAGAGGVVLVLLATACGQAATGVSDPASTDPGSTDPGSTVSASTAPTSSASVADTASPAGPSAPSAAASPAPGATATAALTSCAAQAAHTYFHVLSARRSASDSLLLTGHVAVMICGGPDDWHFDDASATVTATLLPSAHVEVVDMSDGAKAKPVPVSTFITALAHDQSTGTFRVTGPLAAITGLTEIFHP